MKIRYIIILATLLIGFSSCETTEKVDEFPLRPSKLVLNSYFTEGHTWEFQVSKSLSVLDNAEIKFINDAHISLYKGTELIDTIGTADEDNWYRSSKVLPISGEEYSIRVKAEGFDSVLIAKEILPEMVPIIEVSLSITDSSFYTEEYFTGAEIITNRYGWIEGIFEISFSDPEAFDNFYQLSIFSIDTTYYPAYDYETGLPIEDSIITEIHTNEMWFTSIDAASEDDKNETVTAMYSDYIFNGQDYKIKAKFRDWNSSEGKAYVFFLTDLSRTGYLYRKTIAEYRSSNGDPFAEPVQIYSNVENGLGIFAGYSTSEFSFIPL